MEEGLRMMEAMMCAFAGFGAADGEDEGHENSLKTPRFFFVEMITGFFHRAGFFNLSKFGAGPSSGLVASEYF